MSITLYSDSPDTASIKVGGNDRISIAANGKVSADFDVVASSVSYQPAGNIAATSVQGAIQELDSEKQQTLVSGTTIKTVNGESLLGSGNIHTPLSFRNKIINGKMEIAQRGSSFSLLGNTSFYTLDRWLSGQVGSSAISTISVNQDAPTGSGFAWSMRVTVTTAESAPTGEKYNHITHRIEGFNVSDLIGRTFTLSFWVRSSKTGTHCVSVRNSAFDRSYVATYNINTSNTWEYKVVTVTNGIPSGGTWDFANGVGLDVVWTLMNGSSFKTSTTGMWQTGNFISSNDQVNCLDTVGNVFAITGVQLEAGNTATQFEHRHIGTELGMCQRYYEVVLVSAGQYNAGAGNTCAVSVPFKVTKRSVPIVTAGTAYVSINVSSAVFDIANIHGARYVITASGAGVNAAVVDAVCSSEL